MILCQLFIYPLILTISSNLEASNYAEILQMTTQEPLLKIPAHGWNPSMTWPDEKLGID
jgi:hypothetical protein